MPRTVNNYTLFRTPPRGEALAKYCFSDGFSPLRPMQKSVIFSERQNLCGQDLARVIKIGCFVVNVPYLWRKNPKKVSFLSAEAGGRLLNGG